MGRRAVTRAVVTLLAALLGAALLSGSDQPVTARSLSHWQELTRPPMSPRTHSLGVHVRHQVLVLGGVRPGSPTLRSGAAYEVRTGRWRALRTPVAVSDRDTAVVAAGVVVVRHLRRGRAVTWWRYDVRQDAWSRLHGLPRRLSHPTSFGSEVYALSRRRVYVYSVQLDRWTPFPADLLRPVLVQRTVTASLAGTLVTGHPAGHPGRLLTDRWDGVRWHRIRSTSPVPVTAAPDGATRVRIGGRTLVVEGGRAWIHLP